MKLKPLDVIRLLNEILDHQVANRGHGKSAFYICYTYAHGQWPKWVTKAERLLKEANES